MTRLPYPNPETLSPDKREILDSGKPVLNVSRMAMHAADPLWATYRAFAIAARDDQPLDPLQRELVILRVGHLSNSAYEIHHHLHVAQSEGATEAQLEAVRTGEFGALAPGDRLLLEFASQVVTQAAPDADTLAAARDIYSIEDLFGIVMLISGYMTTARLIGLSGIGPEGEE